MFVLKFERRDCMGDDMDPDCKNEVRNEYLTVDRYGLLAGFS